MTTKDLGDRLAAAREYLSALHARLELVRSRGDQKAEKQIELDANEQTHLIYALQQKLAAGDVGERLDAEVRDAMEALVPLVPALTIFCEKLVALNKTMRTIYPTQGGK